MSVHIKGDGSKSEYISQAERKRIGTEAYHAYLKRRIEADGRARATIEDPIVRRVKNWVLYRAKFRDSQWRLALIELKPGRPPDKKIKVDYRDKTIEVLKLWEPLIRGKTDKCSYNKALKVANKLMDKLEGLEAESAVLLQTVGYFDQPWR